MPNENAVLSDEEYNSESFDLDELESKLNSQLESKFEDLEFLEEEKENIGNSEKLVNTIKNVVWEQFLNQLGISAADDFIKENKGLLDLSNDAHIQTTENFANGKIASHNHEIDYQKRFDDWQANFQKDENGKIKTSIDRRTGKEQAVLNKEARAVFDKDRPKGSKTVNKDHTIPTAEVIRDPQANAHLTKEEQIKFANSPENLVDLDSAANQSKSDSSMKDWLGSKNKDGQTPGERFNIDENELLKRDKAAREEYEKLKTEGEKRSYESGKRSQRAEAKCITGSAIRGVVMVLLSGLIREIMSKLIKWFKSSGKKLSTLLDSLKEAVSSFISKLKYHLLNAAEVVVTTVVKAILGPIGNTLSKIWLMLKQGWSSLKEAIQYLKNPTNRGKSIGILILEVGKIVMAGLTAVGGLLLGEAIEKGLIYVCPALGVEIPIIGSLANIIGIFLGAIIAGIIGAIIIHFMQKGIEKLKKRELSASKVDKYNEILTTQNKLKVLSEIKYETTKNDVLSSISDRHSAAAEIIKDSMTKIYSNNCIDSCPSKNDTILDDMESTLDGLLK